MRMHHTHVTPQSNQHCRWYVSHRSALPPLAGKKAKGAAVKGQAPAGTRNVIMWFKQDLRLHDNPALSEAVKLANQLGGTVTFLYVHSPGGSWREPCVAVMAGGLLDKPVGLATAGVLQRCRMWQQRAPLLLP